MLPQSLVIFFPRSRSRRWKDAWRWFRRRSKVQSDGQGRGTEASWTDGRTGADGRTRTDGRTRADGHAGTDGNAWADGRAWVDGHAGADGHAWADGNAGADGRGHDGTNGAYGTDGAHGTNGNPKWPTNGTQRTIIPVSKTRKH